MLSLMDLSCPVFFFFNDTATTEIYTLSLHDALPISGGKGDAAFAWLRFGSSIGIRDPRGDAVFDAAGDAIRSEEHTSELQSPCNLVCRLLLEKKKQQRDDVLDTAHDQPSVVLHDCAL